MTGLQQPPMRTVWVAIPADALAGICQSLATAIDSLEQSRDACSDSGDSEAATLYDDDVRTMNALACLLETVGKEDRGHG